MHCYKATYTGDLKANSEIEFVRWLNLDNISLCAPAAQKAMKNILN